MDENEIKIAQADGIFSRTRNRAVLPNAPPPAYPSHLFTAYNNLSYELMDAAA